MVTDVADRPSMASAPTATSLGAMTIGGEATLSHSVVTYPGSGGVKVVVGAGSKEPAPTPTTATESSGLQAPSTRLH